MVPRLRIFLWSLGAFLVTAALVVAGGVLWLRGSLPKTEGEKAISGLSAPVAVLRDSQGVVTIQAESELDALVALGYVHAQDRLWQMEFMRRTGAGRLSEILGSATVDVDRFIRTLGLYRNAEANLRHLSPPARQALDAYTAGVNAFIDAPGGALPIEFQLLRSAPEAWRPTDSLVWGRLMAFRLSDNWSDELRRARLASRLTGAQQRVIWPAYPDDAPVTIERSEGVGGGTGTLPRMLLPQDASNAWALAGRRTTSGKPILANDPHLALEAPGFWYLVRIEVPGLTLAGATSPGVPFLLLGHNGHIAWGFTTTHSDTQDFFIEREVAGDPARYLSPSGPLAFEIREEVIKVRGEDPITLKVRSSRHGPIMNDVLGGHLPPLRDDEVLALAWPALRTDDRSAEALYRMNRATDWPSFTAALRDFHAPQQNILFADTQGNIGFIAPARVPMRKSGDGTRPVPGWSGEFDWRGFIPFDELPRTLNPESGRIVSANNKIAPKDYPYLVAANWPGPHRARRITALLEARPKSSVDQASAMQLDNYSLLAERLLPLLLRVSPQDERGRRVIESLQAWDYRMSRDRPEPLIFHAWIWALNHLVTSDELGPNPGDRQRPDAGLLASILVQHPEWCDNRGSEAPEDCPTQIRAALTLALDDLSARFGENIDRWRWGAAHQARFPHPVLGRIPVLGGLFAFGAETDGSEETINRGGMRFNGPPETRFEHIHGAGLRAVYDLSDLDNSRFMIATGQSGNPLSPLYGNLAWRDGETIKLLAGDKVSGERLLLIPK
jgi:penicillin amidase